MSKADVRNLCPPPLDVATCAAPSVSYKEFNKTQNKSNMVGGGISYFCLLWSEQTKKYVVMEQEFENPRIILVFLLKNQDEMQKCYVKVPPVQN